MWVEFGPTTAYGQTTSPVSLAAGRAQRVSVVLSSLSAAVHYFAHVVVSSPAGRVSSPDVAFTTLTVTKVMRVAAAGDIACDPDEPNFNGGQGTATACRQFAVSSAILAGGYDAVLPLGDEQYNAGSASAFAASYHPSWGRLDSIAHPVVGNHEYGAPGCRALFPVLRRGGRDTGSGVVLLRARLVARDRLERQLRSHRGGLRRRLAPGALAARRPRRPPRGLHARVLAPAAVHLGSGSSDAGGEVVLGRSLGRGRRDRAQRPRTRVRALRAANRVGSARRRPGHPRVRRGHGR